MMGQTDNAETIWDGIKCWSLIAVAGVMMSGVGSVSAAETEINFSRQILPILSDKCFVCHGPDTQKKDFLRLDSFARATEDRGGYQAINPAQPDESEVLARLHDADDPMPPEDADKQLTAVERDLLSRWVRSGGTYTKHWAFVPPQKMVPPATGGVTHNEVDQFIFATLKSKGVDFAPEADRETLARRAALVLTGLPPEPEPLAFFLADTRPDAYERFVDELLSSPRYGEHQARYWLDAVRYGDTHGLHLDNRRGIFPFRDWVVKAFNDNLPFDDFITWQLAGDLIPNPGLDQLLATGYVRMNPTTSEGGAIPLEFQAKNNFDRTETFGTVFLGMTMTCARCHTHKYDPITQTEYYRLFAFFNSTAESSMDGNAYEYGPTIKVPENPAAWPAWEAFLDRRERLLDRITWVDEDETLVNYANEREDWSASEWRRTPVFSGDEIESGEKDWQPIKGLPGVARRQALPKEGERVEVAFELKIPAELVLWLEFAGGRDSAVTIDGQSITLPALSGGEQLEVLVPLELSAGTHAVRVGIKGSSRRGDIKVRLHHPWDALSKGKEISALSEQERLLMIADSKGPLAKKTMTARALSLAQQFVHQEAQLTTSLIARDLSEPRETKVLRRGEYNLPSGEALEPGVLAVMGGLPSGAPKNRLGLAQWLTSREHPVASRVLINRVWQRVFGVGLVRSPEDFGLQGQHPTHPELLDWLAVEWQDRSWDLKSMIRLMVQSRAFRQSSARQTAVQDPENRLFARGPSYRLDAEVIRDIGLWASGMLDPHMGGEGFKPYQPSGLWKALAHPASNTKQYVRDSGERLYRRSLYVYWKRTSPHPMMTLFDAPSRESSCVGRSRTNTPLQSLGLLNETQRIEMARMLAERLLHERADDQTRLDRLFVLLASRAPKPAERAACVALLTQMKTRYQGAGDDAEALLATGEIARDDSLDLADHAAWTQLVTTVLASDAAILLY